MDRSRRGRALQWHVALAMGLSSLLFLEAKTWCFWPCAQPQQQRHTPTAMAMLKVLLASEALLALAGSHGVEALYLVKLDDERQVCLTPKIACSVMLDNLRFQYMPLPQACQYQKLSHVDPPTAIEQNGVPSSLACAGKGKSRYSRYK